MAIRDYQDVLVNDKYLGRGAEKAEIKKLTAKNQKTGRGVDLKGGLVELKYFNALELSLFSYATIPEK